MEKERDEGRREREKEKSGGAGQEEREENKGGGEVKRESVKWRRSYLFYHLFYESGEVIFISVFHFSFISFHPLVKCSSAKRWNKTFGSTQRGISSSFRSS